MGALGLGLVSRPPARATVAIRYLRELECFLIDSLSIGKRSFFRLLL